MTDLSSKEEAGPQQENNYMPEIENQNGKLKVEPEAQEIHQEGGLWHTIRSTMGHIKQKTNNFIDVLNNDELRKNFVSRIENTLALNKIEEVLENNTAVGEERKKERLNSNLPISNTEARSFRDENNYEI